MQIKSRYGNRSVEHNTNCEHAASHTTALYRRGFSLDRQRTTGTHKRCRRQGSKRRTPNLPYLDWRGGGLHIQTIGNFYYNSRPLDTHTNTTHGYRKEHSDCELLVSRRISESYMAFILFVSACLSIIRDARLERVR